MNIFEISLKDHFNFNEVNGVFLEYFKHEITVILADDIYWDMPLEIQEKQLGIKITHSDFGFHTFLVCYAPNAFKQEDFYNFSMWLACNMKTEVAIADFSPDAIETGFISISKSGVVRKALENPKSKSFNLIYK